MNTSEIESLLRGAPKPRPPAGLKERLIEQAPSRVAKPAPPSLAKPGGFGGWLRRWWPALAPAGISVACAAVMTAQQVEIRALKESIQALSRNVIGPVPAAHAPATPPVEPGASEQQEIARLKELATQLTAEVAQLEQMSAENGQLRAQLAAPTVSGLSPEEAEALAKARAEALKIQCVNNLKQLGLAAKTWAVDNSDVYPSDILLMTNEMFTPKILACPADTARHWAKDWASYTPANCSYEYLAASARSDADPERVMFRCPVHGSVTLCDGSVQSSDKLHPERYVQRDGKLFYEPGRVPAPGGNPP